MSERIYKLQPDRTLALRGFDTFAAAATIHLASPTGFTVSGTFRDPADFAVAVLYDADNFFEHPSIKYLPDFNFTGLTLNFTLQYSDSMQPIDSPKYNWIDWATLDCKLTDGATTRIRLWDHATLRNGFGFSSASATFHVVAAATGIRQYDRVTLWYQNLAYDNYVPAGVSSIELQFYALGTGTNHFININGRNYAHVEHAPVFPSTAGETNAAQAGAILSQMGADPDVIASAGSSANSILLTVKPGSAGTAISVSASEGYGSFTMRLTTPAMIAANLATQINSTDWIAANATFALLAVQNGTAITVTAARYGTLAASGTGVTQLSGAVFSGIIPGSAIRIDGQNYVVASVESPTHLTLTAAVTASAPAVAYVAPRGGLDGNLLQLYATHTTTSLMLDSDVIQLAGGTCGAWDCSIDFSALGIAQLRQCWLTFAPALVTGSYSSQEWQAVFSNWQLTGADPAANRDTKALTFAGPGSVRIEETDSACVFSGAWKTEPSGDPGDVYNAFYSKYFAKLTTDNTASLTVTYTCQFTHDLYIGTALYSNGAVVSVTLDGAAFLLDCSLQNTGLPVITRRRTHVSVPAGKHSVTIRLNTPGHFCFDFLEAAVLSDAPAPLAPRGNISPALDFDTDHTYKLPPARLMWSMDQLGYAGPMNEYLGVFWWNERVQSGGTLSSAQVTFSGDLVQNSVVILTLNQVDLRKAILGNDTLATVAAHFAMYINGSFVGARASADGSVLTITGRSPNANYNLSVTTSTPGIAAIGPAPVAGSYGTWVIDDAANPPINRASRDWHADFYSLCAARSREIVTACSMELVNPPDGYVARFADASRTAVSTATGFGTLVSNHCAAGSSKLLAYQKAVYRQIASLQAAAGLTPSVQYGEFLWWYFPLSLTLPIGYASYTAPISIGTAAAHGLSTGEKVAIAGVSGNTAANGAWTITVVDSTHFTLNGSNGNGAYTSGGTVTITGGMACYDDETMAAAQTALGRPLHLFSTPNDDPGVNGSADAVFLRNRLRDHVATLVADMRSAHSTAKCEVLWPYDVNYPTPVPANAPNLGGRLNRFINLPVEWQTKSTSGLDRMKIEALAFGTSLRDMNLAKDAIHLFRDFGWPADSLRYLVPVFGSATPWHRELALTKAAGIGPNNLWAFDHICLYNLDVPERGLERRSTVKAA